MASTADPRADSHAAPLLPVRDLAVDFSTIDGPVRAVNGVDLDITAGETVAIVGESGSGKSTTAMAIIGLLASGGRVTTGSISLEGEDLTRVDEKRLQQVRGRTIGLVPQDPMSNLNPVAKIGTQVAETLLAHGLASRRDVADKVVAALSAAGLPDAAARAKQYPHEFSGGMRQRALIAIGMACQPRFLIADEPTSSPGPGQMDKRLTTHDKRAWFGGWVGVAATVGRGVSRRDRRDRPSVNRLPFQTSAKPLRETYSPNYAGG